MPKIKTIITIPNIYPDQLDRQYNIQLTSNLNNNIKPLLCTPLKTIIPNKNINRNYFFFR